MKTAEYILQMGYWSDEMEERGEGPDVFFIHFQAKGAAAVPQLEDAVQLLVEAWADKYGTQQKLLEQDLDVQDCFWSCSPGSAS